MNDTIGGGGILSLGDMIFEDQYEVIQLLGSGNSGEVYRLSHPRHGTNRVIKLFVPFYELRQARLGESDQSERSRTIIENAKNQPYQRREYSFLSRIDHPFITKVHDYNFHNLSRHQKARLEKIAGTASDERIHLPFIIAMYVEGKELKNGLRSLSRSDVLKVLRSITEAIDYIHVQHDILHLDIKSTNVRVRSDGYPILLDFALSQDFSVEALATDTRVRGGIDWDLTPFRHGTSNIAEFIRRTQTEGISRQEFRDEGFPGLDLYQVGLMMRACQEDIKSVLTPAEQQYFMLICNELTEWNAVREREPGTLSNLFDKIDSTQVYLAIRPGSMHGAKEIYLSSDRRVFVPPKLVPVVEHPEVIRLSRLSQLSLLSSEFAGATHSRYEHSLDVLRIAQSAVRRLLDDPKCRQVLGEADIELLLTTALLHDINHLPMTHLYQESDLNLLDGRDLFSEALRYEHEGHKTLADVISETLEQDPDRLLRLLVRPWERQASEADRIISSLIDSGADIDKLSYLRLDSERSGLGFAGGIDAVALLEAMSVVEYERLDDDGRVIDSGLHVAFTEEALPLIEALAMVRTRGFHDLYWCAENRAMMAQVLACARAIAQESDDDEVLNKLLIELRGGTEYEVLVRLDKLAEKVVGRKFGLASLLDVLRGSTPTLVYSSSQHTERIRLMSPPDRQDFEFRLGEELSRIVPNTSDSVVMVDVPRRSLNLGGRVVIVDAQGKGRDALEISGVLESQMKRLRQLTDRSRIFVSGIASPEWRAAVDLEGPAMMRKVMTAIDDVLGRSSLR